ncbi:MAG: putative toxin-antitoxin system toxin component, PIN family [Deltaproteobacteria bacterium]|nr:putative toxin-antitoxin system toxin component, PIN family [Deltaproteobacteria bacterium]
MIDTGVLVSAFSFGGTPAKAVKRVFSEADIFVSLELLKEYRDVPLELHKEGKIDSQQLRALIAGIATVVSGSTVVVPKRKLAICRDPEDDMLLECCRAAHADILITGDKDLLDMRSIPFPLTIMNPARFVAQ